MQKAAKNKWQKNEWKRICETRQETEAFEDAEQEMQLWKGSHVYPVKIPQEQYEHDTGHTENHKGVRGKTIYPLSVLATRGRRARIFERINCEVCYSYSAKINAFGALFLQRISERAVLNCHRHHNRFKRFHKCTEKIIMAEGIKRSETK